MATVDSRLDWSRYTGRSNSAILFVGVESIRSTGCYWWGGCYSRARSNRNRNRHGRHTHHATTTTTTTMVVCVLSLSLTVWPALHPLYSFLCVFPFVAFVSLLARFELVGEQEEEKAKETERKQRESTRHQSTQHQNTQIPREHARTHAQDEINHEIKEPNNHSARCHHVRG